MRVRVVFDRPFYGMVFSKGFYRWSQHPVYIIPKATIITIICPGNLYKYMHANIITTIIISSLPTTATSTACTFPRASGRRKLPSTSPWARCGSCWSCWWWSRWWSTWWSSCHLGKYMETCKLGWTWGSAIWRKSLGHVSSRKPEWHRTGSISCRKIQTQTQASKRWNAFIIFYISLWDNEKTGQLCRG